MSVAEQVIEKLNVLAPEEQRKVLAFVETLALQHQEARKMNRKHPGEAVRLTRNKANPEPAPTHEQTRRLLSSSQANWAQDVVAARDDRG